MNIIEVNKASKSDLQELTGIGPKIADYLIQGRPYLCPNQLLDVEGMSKKLLESLEEQGLWVDSEPEGEILRNSQQMDFPHYPGGGCGE